MMPVITVNRVVDKKEYLEAEEEKKKNLRPLTKLNLQSHSPQGISAFLMTSWSRFYETVSAVI
jgi:hypothetical protein